MYDEEENDSPEGSYPINLSEKAKASLECLVEENLSLLEPLKMISIDTLKKYTSENPESEFTKFEELIKTSILDDVCIIYDDKRQYGSDYLLCLTEQAIHRFKQIEAEKDMNLINRSITFKGDPSTPKKWHCLDSDKEVEQDWVKNSRAKIRILVKRSIPRNKPLRNFEDRNVEDVSDGYMACEAYTDSTTWIRVDSMNRGMQAVSTLIDRTAQTELKYPKNVACQYEARIFTEEEIQKHCNSPEMNNFFLKINDIVEEVIQNPDIMGRFRNDIIKFYKRDEKEEIDPKDILEVVAFSDLSLTYKLKVSHIRWHPKLEGIMAMSVMENSDIDMQMKYSSDRTIVPNFLLVWSFFHPIFPQFVLRIPDNVTKFEWHPHDPDILVGGCFNGQIVVWDINIYLLKLESKTCIWKYEAILDKSTEKVGLEDGVIPILHWSAESRIAFSHRLLIEDLKWLPSNVYFSPDSSYPRKNTDESFRQFITCSSGDSFILIWSFEIFKNEEDEENSDNAPSYQIIKESGWDKYRRVKGMAVKREVYEPQKTPAIGKYNHLDQIWKPVHKISFLLHSPKKGLKDYTPFRCQITSVSMIDRPELSASRRSSYAQMDSFDDEEDNDSEDDYKGSPNSKQKFQKKKSNKRKSLEKNEFAMPIDFIGGTYLGGIFKADLSFVKVQIETGELQCRIEWKTAIHDGPTIFLERSPFDKNVILSMGGYSVAIWKDIKVKTPVILHFVDYDEEFTYATWSPTRPSVFFLGGSLGNIQAWQVMSRQSSPFFKQNISGKAITAICPNFKDPKGINLMSVGDSTGTVRLLSLTKDLRDCKDNEFQDFLTYIDKEIDLIEEKNERLLEKKESSTAQKLKFSSSKNDGDITDEAFESSWSGGSEFWKDYFFSERQYLKNEHGASWRTKVNPDISLDRNDFITDFDELRKGISTSSYKSDKSLKSILNAVRMSGVTDQEEE